MGAIQRCFCSFAFVFALCFAVHLSSSVPVFPSAPWYQPSLRPHTPLLCLALQYFSSGRRVATWAHTPLFEQQKQGGRAITAVGSRCPRARPHVDKNLLRAEKNQNTRGEIRMAPWHSRWSVLLGSEAMFTILRMALQHSKKDATFSFWQIISEAAFAAVVRQTNSRPFLSHLECCYQPLLPDAAENSKVSLPNQLQSYKVSWKSALVLHLSVVNGNMLNIYRLYFLVWWAFLEKILLKNLQQW